MRVEQFVGQRVKQRREELTLTQEQFGQELAPYLGKAWSRSTVSVAESGGRAFTAAELVAIALVLETRAARLITPGVDVRSIEFPSRLSLPAGAVAPITGPADQQLASVWADLQQALKSTEDTNSAVRSAAEKLFKLIAMADLATMDSDGAEQIAPFPDRKAEL